MATYLGTCQHYTTLHNFILKETNKIETISKLTLIVTDVKYKPLQNLFGKT